jgi:hypothetical protein
MQGTAGGAGSSAVAAAFASKDTVVSSFVMVKNYSEEDYSSIKLNFFSGANTITKDVTLRAGEAAEVRFDWLTPAKAGSVTVSANINPGRTPAESGYSNNRAEFAIAVEDVKADLLATGILPDQYPAGKRVVTLVSVRNDSDYSYRGANAVEVLLSIPDAGVYTTATVSMDAGAEQYVPFTWTAPSALLDFNITAYVNPAKAIPETDYVNNGFILTAKTIGSEDLPYGCNMTRRTWTEPRFSHTKTVRFTIDGVEYEKEVDVYKDVEFYAEVSMRNCL